MKRMALLLGAFVLTAVAWATTRTLTDEVTSSDGGPVAFPGGIDLAEYSSTPVSQLSYFTSGQHYDATATGVTNVDLFSPAKPSLRYVVQGNYVHVFGRVGVNATSSATLTTFTLTTPVVRASNFSGTSGASGMAGVVGAVKNGVCRATDSAKTVTCTFESVDHTTADPVNVNFTYTTSGN